MAEQIRAFYADLSDPLMVTAFGIVHSRFSTNTLGEWRLAHPYRYLSHNGEINTVRGNRNWMSAREGTLTSELFGEDVSKLAPVCLPDVSDTASLDHAFELLVLGGRDIDHVAAMMIPEAWFGHEAMPQDSQGLLRVPRLPDGALGRSRAGGVHGWPQDRRGAGSQRPAPVPLHDHHRRAAGHGL